MKVTPKQIAANAILQLSSMELQNVINQELQENPALEKLRGDHAIILARRTVAKYREELKILPARLRKRA